MGKVHSVLWDTSRCKSQVGKPMEKPTLDFSSVSFTVSFFQIYWDVIFLPYSVNECIYRVVESLETQIFHLSKNTADPPFRGHCRQARSGLDCGPVPIAPDECHQKVDISEDCFTAMAQR